MAFVATDFAIRQRIMAELERLMKEQTKGVDGYNFTWSEVQREPFPPDSARRNYSLAIINPSELKDNQIQNQHALLDVVFNWSIIVAPGCNPDDEAIQVMEHIERRLNIDLQLHEGGILTEPDAQALTFDVQVLGTDHEVEGGADRHIEGNVDVRVLYKHKVNDPRGRN